VKGSSLKERGLEKYCTRTPAKLQWQLDGAYRRRSAVGNVEFTLPATCWKSQRKGLVMVLHPRQQIRIVAVLCEKSARQGRVTVRTGNRHFGLRLSFEGVVSVNEILRRQ
jgi:hypothetical protein